MPRREVGGRPMLDSSCRSSFRGRSTRWSLGRWRDPALTGNRPPSPRTCRARRPRTRRMDAVVPHPLGREGRPRILQSRPPPGAARHAASSTRSLDGRCSRTLFPTRTRADVGGSGVRPVVAANPVAEESHRFLGHPAAAGLPRVHRNLQTLQQPFHCRQHHRCPRVAEHRESRLRRSHFPPRFSGGPLPTMSRASDHAAAPAGLAIEALQVPDKPDLLPPVPETLPSLYPLILIGTPRDRRRRPRTGTGTTPMPILHPCQRNLATEFRQVLSEGRCRLSVDVEWRVENLKHFTLTGLERITIIPWRDRDSKVVLDPYRHSSVVSPQESSGLGHPQVQWADQKRREREPKGRR